MLVPPGPVATEVPPVADLSDAATIAKVLSLLAGFGVSDVQFRVESSIPPPAANKQKSAGPEKQLQIIAGKIPAGTTGWQTCKVEGTFGS